MSGTGTSDDPLDVAFAVRLHLRHVRPSILEDPFVWGRIASRLAAELFPPGVAGAVDWVVHPDPEVVFPTEGQVAP